MRLFIFSFALLTSQAFCQLTVPAPKPIIGARYPALSPDGQQIAFVYRGDVWRAKSSGGEATPVTNHLEHDAYPLFSPDGNWIAFGSKRHGHWDIFIIPSKGGTPRRLTWHSGSEIPFGWSPDGKNIAFASRRNRPNYEIMTVNVSTLRSNLICEDYAPLRYPRWSPDGKKMVYTRYGMPWYRPRYRGSAAAQVWIYDAQTNKRRKLLGEERQHLFSQFMPDGKQILLVTTAQATPTLSNIDEKPKKFSDNSERTPNLWISDLKGKLKQITHFKADSVRYPSIAAKSGDIAFEHDDGIWLFSHKSKNPKKIQLHANADVKRNTKEFAKATSGVTEAEPSPDGKTILFGLQGDIWTVKAIKSKGINKELDEVATQHTKWAGDDSDFSWSKDGKKFYFTSDREGNTRIYEYDLEKKKQKSLWNRNENIVRLRVSPDGKHLFFWVTGTEGGLHRLTLDNLKTKRIFKLPGIHMRGRGGIDYEWSPDGKWIAYTTRTGSSSYNIWVIPAEGGEAKNITQLSAFHSQPTWSVDGKYIYFQSNRSGEGLYRVALQPDKFRNSDIDQRFVKPSKTPEVKIDFEGITERIQKISSTNPESDLTMTLDGRLYFLSDGNVYRSTHEGKEVKKLNDDGGRVAFRVLPNGRGATFMKSGGIYLMKLENGSTAPVTFAANVTKDINAKRTAAFYQFWKTYDHRFYDSNFHGRDWAALREKYIKRLTAVDTNDEFAILLQMMVGELDSSHSELSPSSSGISHRSTPHLGFTIDYTHKGVGLKIKHVPDKAPGSYEKTMLKPGEYIIAIDGKKVSGDEALHNFLTQKTTRLTTFTVNSKPTTSDSRKVSYKLLSSTEWTKLRYNEKVQELRNRVEQSSDGKIGYLHISAMGSKDQERFEREAYEYIQGKDAMIFDVRFNNGGNISDTLIDWLERKPHGIYKSRDREPEMAPSKSWNKPIVVLMNEHSYSNGEMFPYAMRERGLAKLVGMPTPGYVIWTSSFTLTDGTKARIPGRGVFRLDGSNMENIGEKPDFQLWITPDQWLKNEDPQLAKAIDLLREKPVNKPNE
jgi:Tol biopolymer transport system component/C-terminal processing protease CtpA/Prc